MEPITMTFLDAVVVTVAAILVGGIITVVKMLFGMSREVGTLGTSMQAIYRIQPLLIKAQRHQNAALRQLGANGPTDDSDACLDEARGELDRRLAERVGGCA